MTFNTERLIRMRASAETAQWWETTDNPAPDNGRVNFMQSFDGKLLRYATFPALLNNNSIHQNGTILLIHGRNQSIEHYFELIAHLNNIGLSVATLDWRGQGGSQRLIKNPALGHVRRFSDYTNDFQQFIDDIVSKNCPPPYYIVAHSAGALIALNVLQGTSHPIEKAVLVAPLLSLTSSNHKSHVLFSLVSAFRWLGFGKYSLTKIFNRRRKISLRHNPYTSDEIRYQKRLNMLDQYPHLSLGAPSFLWLYETLKTARKVSKKSFIKRLNTPILLIAAGNDQIVSASAAEHYAKRLHNSICLTIDEAKHDLIHEADLYRDQFLSALENFILSKTAEYAIKANERVI